MSNKQYVTRHLEERPGEGGRLGRHVEHDPRSLDFGFGVSISPLKQVRHRRHGNPFDQGDLGSCTGNAAAGLVNTEPFVSPTHPHTLLKEADAVKLYELATQLDDYPGQYPPDDTGSSGLAVAKAARQKGYIRAFRHAFSIDEALSALQVMPVITGVSWYEGFDKPDPTGRVKLSGEIRGGHEFEVIGYSPSDSPGDAMIEAVNSWGPNWGKGGHFFFTVSTWYDLLHAEGDVTVLVP